MGAVPPCVTLVTLELAVRVPGSVVGSHYLTYCLWSRVCRLCGLCLGKCSAVCVWGPGPAFLGKSGSYGASVGLCTRVPVFLGGGPGLCCVCHRYMSVGLFWESLHLGCESLQYLWRGPVWFLRGPSRGLPQCPGPSMLRASSEPGHFFETAYPTFY